MEEPRAQTATSVAYSHSWNVGPAARMGLKLNVRSAAYAPPPGGEPTVGITWNWDL